MKTITTLTAAAIAAVSFVAVAAPGGPGTHHHGRFAERLQAADTNGDGMISNAEAAALPMIARNFAQIDANRDGQVTTDELRAFHEQHRGQRFAEHFKRLDTDGDGKVSKAEAQSHPRLNEHFAEIDANGDGFLTADELKAARRAHHAHGPK